MVITSKFQPAGAAEILRSSQKDEEYMRILRNLFSDVIQKCLGIPTWIKWQNFINPCSDVFFYYLTTLSGLQTLGEEYANIVQVDRSLQRVPSKWKHAVDVALQTFGYYSLLRFQQLLENHMNLCSAVADKFGNDSLESKIANYMPFIFKFLTVLQRIHLIIFYLNGSYYTVSKRLTGIKYVVIRRWLTHPFYQRPFKILGWIAAFQLFLSLLTAVYTLKLTNSLSNSSSKQKIDSDKIVAASLKTKCALCLEKRNHSTVTPCGHMFCWSCITSWMQNKEECPLCREAFPPAKLVYLQNYF